jgi:DNA polymerase (family 10)
MAEEAKKLGLEYIVISDHAKSLAMTGGLDEKAMLKQGKEINRVNEQLEGIRILKGVEANILKDGSLDLPDSILKQLEFVAVGVHSHFNMSKEEMTKRIIKAMENEHVDYLCHPTGREIQKREPYPVDVQKIIEVAKATGTVLDIDAYPDRLDLKDEHIRFAVQVGAKLGISSDAHSKVHLHFLEFGIAQARRGWATAKDIINTLPVNKLLKVIK